VMQGKRLWIIWGGSGGTLRVWGENEGIRV
jgi:hypothetical protein